MTGFQKLPPSTNLEAKLPCAPTVDNVSAIEACEFAAIKSGLRVAARTKRSLLLMPGGKRALWTCMAPGMSGRASHAGHGITAELVPGDDGEGLAVSVMTPSGAKRGQTFIQALNTQLISIGSSGATPKAALRRSGSAGSTSTQDTVMSSASRVKNELSAYYYFSKLLLSDKQPPGMAAAQFVQRFYDTYKGLSPTAVEQSRPMRECMAAVDQLCRLIEELLANMEDDALLNIAEVRPWMRNSVERCVFARVGQTLWHLYDGRHSAEDTQYAQKVSDLSRVSDAALLEALGVRRQFQGPEVAVEPSWSSAAPSDCSSPKRVEGQCAQELEDSAIGSSVTRSTAATTEESVTSSRDQHSGFKVGPGGPYERAAAALSQIEVSLLNNRGRNCTPREAIEALTFSQFEMKTCAVEVTCGQLELCSMDDILPVFIFILVRSALTKPFACSRFMNDALSRDESLESEGRAVLLLESAARHVAYDWDIGELLSESGGYP